MPPSLRAWAYTVCLVQLPAACQAWAAPYLDAADACAGGPGEDGWRGVTNRWGHDWASCRDALWRGSPSARLSICCTPLYL